MNQYLKKRYFYFNKCLIFSINQFSFFQSITYSGEPYWLPYLVLTWTRGTSVTTPLLLLLLLLLLVFSQLYIFIIENLSRIDVFSIVKTFLFLVSVNMITSKRFGDFFHDDLERFGDFFQDDNKFSLKLFDFFLYC